MYVLMENYNPMSLIGWLIPMLRASSCIVSKSSPFAHNTGCIASPACKKGSGQTHITVLSCMVQEFLAPTIILNGQPFCAYSILLLCKTKLLCKFDETLSRVRVIQYIQCCKQRGWISRLVAAYVNKI